MKRSCPLCGSAAAKPLLHKEGSRYVKCSDCGLVYADAPPDEQTLKEVAEDWARKHHSSPERLEWEKRQALQHILFGRRMKIINRYRRLGGLLDVGCSTGYFLDYARREGWEIAGCEIARHTAEFATERLGVEIRKGSFPDCRYPGARFDVVTMWDVIEHVMDPGAFIAEAFRVLRPGGLLVIGTPNYNSLSRRVIGDQWEPLCPQRHLTLFTPATLAKLVTTRGGKTTHIRTADVNPLDLLAALRGRKIDFESRQRNIGAVKGAFTRIPMLSRMRDMANIILTLLKAGDVLELYAERLPWKICLLTQQFGRRWSGLGTYATNLIEGLTARGLKPVVICPEGMGQSKGARIVSVKMRGWEKAVNYWLPLAWEFRRALDELLREEKFDVVHFTDAREALFAKTGAAKMVGTMNDYYAASAPLNPLYFRRHYSDWPVRYPYYRLVKAIEPMAIRKLDAVIANSNHVRDVLTDNYSINLERIRVIHYGIDLPAVETTGEMLEGAPSILFVGANFQRKGLPDLLRAAAIAKAQLPGLVAHVVGEDAKKDILRNLARELGLLDAVRFWGLKPNDEVRKMRAHIFAMPSLIEGFGIVFLEAMHAGMPVIGGRVGGTVELIRDGENGFTVTPGDIEDLARKLVILYNDGKTRERFIEQGRQCAGEFTIDKMVSDTITLYESLMEKRR